MADKWKSAQDEPVGGPDEELRGVADDEDEFDATENLDDEDDEEDDEEGATF